MRKTSLLLLLLLASQAFGQTPEAWFDRMRTALQESDYEGRFVYQVGDQLDAMYVVHRISGVAELERLVALNGDGRQVIRGSHAVACLLPGGNLASVVESASSSVPQAHIASGDLSFYQLRLGGQSRVAGRAARVLDVLPRDSFRFGYRLFLDEESGLPLRMQTVEQTGEIRAQVMFVDLRIGKDVTPIEHDLSALSLTERPLTINRDLAKAEQSGWQFTALPPGFHLSRFRYEQAHDRRHFILSDGLAAVSVYIEPAEAGLTFGHSKMGAINTYGAELSGMQIIALGEVPIKTLEAVVSSLQPR